MSSTGGGFRSGFDREALTSLKGMMVIAATVVLFVAVLFVVFLHLFARRARRQTVAEVEDPAGSTVSPSPRKGLDAAIVRALPVLVFRAGRFKEGLECSVCLCELSDGEKARLLPNCNHGFHLDCIDMWFQSHSTCPLCRDVVAPTPRSGDPPAMEVLSLEPLSFPTNVLFWGNEGEVVNARVTRLEEGSSSSSSSSSNGGEGELGNASSGEQEKSTATRFRSLKRLLSRDRRVVAPCGSSGGDVEQGFDGNGLNQ